MIFNSSNITGADCFDFCFVAKYLKISEMMASAWAETLSDWRSSLEELKSFVVLPFQRVEHRRTCIDSLLSGVEHKIGWMLSEEAGFGLLYRI